jgi:hypothetical protein
MNEQLLIIFFLRQFCTRLGVAGYLASMPVLTSFPYILMTFQRFRFDCAAALVYARFSVHRDHYLTAMVYIDQFAWESPSLGPERVP